MATSLCSPTQISPARPSVRSACAATATAFRAAADTDLPTAKFDMMDHDAFMERARKAFAVVQTGETALYGNIIIRKGVVRA